MIRRWLVVVAGIALVCAGCGGSSASRPLATAVDGPIVAVASAASVYANGQSASAPSSGCTSDPVASWVDFSQKVELTSGIRCPKAGPGVTWSGTMFATMATTLVPIGEMGSHPSEGEGAFFEYVDPCSLPGGSDLPGAKLTWAIDIYKPGPAKTFTYHYTLPDDKAPPLLRVNSTPIPGTKVHEGQTITVHITATAPNDQGPHEGIHDIQLTGPDGLVDSQDYGTHPVACDKARLTKTFTTTYTVPKNPPAIITLTAHAADFVNNQAAPKSAQFPTGNTWTGTVHTVTHITDPPECPATLVLDGTISLTVAASGTVQGTGTWHSTATSCGPAEHETYPFGLSGQLAGGAFHLTSVGSRLGYDLGNGGIMVPLSSSKTTAATQFHGSGSEGGTTWTFSGTITLHQT